MGTRSTITILFLILDHLPKKMDEPFYISTAAKDLKVFPVRKAG